MGNMNSVSHKLSSKSRKLSRRHERNLSDTTLVDPSSLYPSKSKSPAPSLLSSGGVANYEWLEGRKFIEDHAYLLPKDDTEGDSLTAQHYVFKSVLGANYTAPISAESLHECLDVGSGTGVWSMDMAIEFPGCHFTGIDLSPQSPCSVFPRNCTFESGDVVDGLPYDDSSFQFVHSRLLLSWQRRDTYLSILDEMCRVTAPGGYIELMEANLELSDGGPLTRRFNEAWRRVMDSRSLVDDRCVRGLAAQLQERRFECRRGKYSIPIGAWGGQIGKVWAAELKVAVLGLGPKLRGTLGMGEGEYIRFVDAMFVQLDEDGCRAHMDFYNVWGKKSV